MGERGRACSCSVVHAPGNLCMNNVFLTNWASISWEGALELPGTSETEDQLWRHITAYHLGCIIRISCTVVCFVLDLAENVRLTLTFFNCQSLLKDIFTSNSLKGWTLMITDPRRIQHDPCVIRVSHQHQPLGCKLWVGRKAFAKPLNHITVYLWRNELSVVYAKCYTPFLGTTGDHWHFFQRIKSHWQPHSLAFPVTSSTYLVNSVKTTVFMCWLCRWHHLTVSAKPQMSQEIQRKWAICEGPQWIIHL